jgi:hypothetical protein
MSKDIYGRARLEKANFSRFFIRQYPLTRMENAKTAPGLESGKSAGKAKNLGESFE